MSLLLQPCAITARYSVEHTSRRLLGNRKAGAPAADIDKFSLGAQALRRARPRARRALITARPPRVRILARNPWVRLRLISLGWKVRFIYSLIDLRNVLERLGNRGYSAAELLSSNPRRWIRFRRRLRSALHPCCPRFSPGSSLWDYLVRTLCFAVLCHT